MDGRFARSASSSIFSALLKLFVNRFSIYKGSKSQRSLSYVPSPTLALSSCFYLSTAYSISITTASGLVLLRIPWGRRKTRECASCLCCVYGFSNTREIARSLGFKVAYYSFDDNSHHGGKTGFYNLGLEMNCTFPSFKVSPLGNHLWRCARKCYVLNAVFAFVYPVLSISSNVISKDLVFCYHVC